MISMAEAAKRYGVSKQAIYISVAAGKLKAEKIEGRWHINPVDLDAYWKTRYSRLKSKDVFGGLIYNPSEGRYSPNMLAKALGLATQKVYYALRHRGLSYEKHLHQYVIQVSDLEAVKSLINGSS